MDLSGVGSLRCLRWAAMVVGTLLALFVVCMFSEHVAAATITVTVNTDTTTGIAANCPGASCSLRDAVAFANANDSTTITFQAGLASPIILTQVTTLTLTRTTGSGTTITGPGVALLAVDGGYTGGSTGVTVFTINSGVTASISGVTIQNGNAGGGTGGGILNNGSLTLANVTLRANHAAGYIGGGLYSAGSLTTGANTTIGGATPADANTADLAGGICNTGVWNAQTGLTVSNNTALRAGGIYNTGAWNAPAGLTVSNNTASYGGGGIRNASGANTVTLAAPTISRNQVTAGGDIGGGGIANDSGSTMTITGGTIAGNQVGTGAVGGGIANGGTLTLDAVTVGGTNPGDANSTTNNVGGGIFNGGMLTVRNNTTILGNTAGSAGGGIYVSSAAGATAIITNSTIGGTTAGSGNTAGGGGGGILNNGTITLSNARVAGNQANGGDGGGIANGGSATITNSTIGGTTTAGGNSAPNGNGGGIANTFGSTLHVTGSTISGNSASSSTGGGGGIFNANTSAVIDTTTIGGATAAEGNSAVVGGGIETQGSTPSSLTLTNSTVSHNTTTSSVGGGIYGASILTISGSTISANATTAANQTGGGIEVAGGPAAITNSTISGNTATGAGGAIDNQNGAALTLTQVTVAANSTGINTTGGVTIKNSILANTGANCAGTAVTDGQYNLDSGTTCGLTDATDLTNTNPQLGPLQLNAPGTTATHALLANSPARDRIPNSGANCTATDQRGVARPAPAGGLCDIGAFEAAPLIPAAITVTGFPSPITAGALGTFTVTITDGSGNTVTSYSGTVHFTSSDPQATAGAGLPADFTFPFSGRGSHTFTNGATLKTAGTQSITATDTLIATITGSQTGIIVTPAATSALLVAGFPNPVNANMPGTVTVSARDAFANLTPNYTGTVHLTSNDPLAILPADYTFTTGSGNDNGVHTFSVTLKSAGSPPKSITATDATHSLTGMQSGIVVNPTLTRVEPSSGPIGGGAAVTLHGFGFAAGAAVTFDMSAATNVTVVNDTTITCTTPAHSAGAVTVKVTIAGATGTLPGAYTYGIVNVEPPPRPGPPPSGGPPHPAPPSRPGPPPSGGPPAPLPKLR